MSINVIPLRGQIPAWSFSDRIRKVRREILGVGQQEAADQLGVGLKAYSSWEAGRTEPQNILAIAARLEEISGVPRTWFIGWTTDDPTDGPSSPRRDSNAQPTD